MRVRISGNNSAKSAARAKLGVAESEAGQLWEVVPDAGKAKAESHACFKAGHGFRRWKLSVVASAIIFLCANPTPGCPCRLGTGEYRCPLPIAGRGLRP